MTRFADTTFRLVLILVGLVAQSSLAEAATIDLFCQQSGASGGYGLNVSIDTTASTAVAWTTGFKRTDVPLSRATITTDQVTWGQPVNNAPQYTLDRNSGALIQLSPNRMGGPFAVSETLSCRKATPVL
jgi:hypothetical protein